MSADLPVYDQVRGRNDAAIIYLFLAITTITVALRIYVRAFLTRNLALDDFWLVLSQTITNVGAGICAYIDAKAGKYPPSSQALWDAYGNVFFAAASCWTTTSILLKFSIAGWFLRLTHHKSQRYPIYTAVAMYTTFFTIFSLILVFRCGAPYPVYIIFSRADCAVNWNVLYPLYFTAAAFNAVCDWVFALIAIALVVSTRKMKTGARLSVCFVVLLAIAGSLVSVVRFPFLEGWKSGPGFLDVQGLATLLSIVETEISTMAISLATLMPLMRLLQKKILPLLPRSIHNERKNFAGNRSSPTEVEIGPQPIIYPTAQSNLGVLPNTLPTMLTYKSAEPSPTVIIVEDSKV
ncbi:hypothetical protein MBLNU457_3225t1 [Dothideomycetes sp. NU457]